MESPSIELKGSLSIATETTLDSHLQEDKKEFSEASEKAFAPHSDIIQTTSVTAGSVESVQSNIATTSKPIIKSKKFSKKKCSSFICLAFVILFGLAISLVPIILFITLSPQRPSFLDDIDFQSCSVDTGVQEALYSDSTLIQVCEAENNQILDNDCNNVSAIRALQLVYALGTQLMNDKCTEDGLPFFCTAIDSLCVGSTNLSLNEKCIQVRDNRCSTEWRIIENLFNISVPSCDSFKNGTNVIFSSAPIQTCPDLFEVFCGSLCLPSCQQITLLRDGVNTAFRVWFTILYAVNVIGGVITIIASIVYRQKMLRYPLIFVVYSALTLQVNGIFFVLPTILGSNDILCADSNMFVAISDSTVFCQIQGFVVQASLIMFLGFWNAHVFHMLYSIAFPFRANRFMTSHSATRRVHCIEVFIIISLGLLSSTININITGYRFVGFPGICVLTTLDGYFYTHLVPLTIGCGIGVVTLCSLVLIVRNRKRVNSSRKPRFTKFSTAETKLFIVFLYAAVTTLSFLCNFCAFLYSNEEVTSRIADYVICIAGGDKLECHGLLDRLYDGTTALLVFDWISATLGQLISIATLNFVLQYSDIKKIIRYLFNFIRPY